MGGNIEQGSGFVSRDAGFDVGAPSKDSDGFVIGPVHWGEGSKGGVTPYANVMEYFTQTQALPNLESPGLREAFVRKDLSSQFPKGGAGMSRSHVSFVL